MTEETLLSQKVGKTNYNVSGDSGALTDTYGIGEVFAEDGSKMQGTMPVDSVWFFNLGENGNRYFMHGGSYGDLIYFDTLHPTGPKSTLLSYDSPPALVKFRLQDDDSVLITHPDGPFAVYQNFGLYKYEEGPKFKSVCVHYERLFGITGQDNILYFSANLDPLNWNVSSEEGGSPFSSRALMIYALKLQLIERSSSFSEEKGSKEFDRLYKTIEEDIFR